MDDLNTTKCFHLNETARVDQLMLHLMRQSLMFHPWSNTAHDCNAGSIEHTLGGKGEQNCLCVHIHMLMRAFKWTAGTEQSNEI